MNMFAKLFSIEWIKARKRSVFWVAIVAHAVIIAIALGGQQYIHSVKPKNPAFQLPGGWDNLIMIGAQTGMLMLLIAVTLLTASEATWRTQRQNVIDGLSRGQYFAGKILVVLMLAVILWIDIGIVGMIVAPFGGSGSLQWPVFSDLALRMLPNVLLYFVALGITAFMFGMLASSSGAALGLMFAFLLIEPIIAGIMIQQGGMLPTISRYLPLDVFSNLVARGSYDAAMMAKMNEAMVKNKLPALLSLSTSVVLALCYIAAFAGIAWLNFRKRDL